MKLTAEQFIAIAISLQENAGSSTTGARRQPRREIEAEATIVPLAERPISSSVMVRDVSASGIGFLSQEKMTLDEQFVLMLPRTNGEPSIVLCSVAFWQPLPSGLFGIGARFVRLVRDRAADPISFYIESNRANVAPPRSRRLAS